VVERCQCGGRLGKRSSDCGGETRNRYILDVGADAAETEKEEDAPVIDLYRSRATRLRR
jgi:hypothetical protein